jgi:sec-independent protein translocase protein TatA
MPGFIGLPEIMLLALVALIVFGPKRLPEMGRGLGKGMREFKESVTGDNNHAVVAPIAPAPEVEHVTVVEHVEHDEKVA